MASSNMMVEKNATDEANMQHVDESSPPEEIVSVCPQCMTFKDLLLSCLNLIYSSIHTKDLRLVSRALRHLRLLRKDMNIGILWTLLDELDSSLAVDGIGKLTPGLPETTSGLTKSLTILAEAARTLEGYVVSCQGVKDEKETFHPPKKACCISTKIIPDHSYGSAIYEVQVFLVILAIIAHIDGERYTDAIALSKTLLEKVAFFNRRTMDSLTAKAFFYYSLAHERNRSLSSIRKDLLNGYRTASLHQDIMAQATLLNLLLRNYLHYSLHEMALKLVSKASYPENLRPNAQYARYLFYLGLLQAIQLDYTGAHAKLTQALRKAPQKGLIGRGFRLIATKLSVVVELLMGDIPDRQVFNQEDLRHELFPYQQIVQAVRTGDLHSFKKVIDTHQSRFLKDGTLPLVKRLDHSVIRTGLRMINISYSRIHLTDISNKLGLESAADAECIVAKAIKDEVIDVVIDHSEQFVKSKPKNDLYSTNEPSKALHKRIAFCLQLHSDAIKAMQYPEEREDRTEENESLRREQEEMAQVSNEDFEGDDLDML